jgi:hypothetical protein
MRKNNWKKGQAEEEERNKEMLSQYFYIHME